MQSTEISTSSAPAPPKPVKEKRIPPKISQIIDWLLTGACKNQQAACDRINLDPSYVSRELRKVHVQAFIARRTRETIDAGTMRAASRLVELIDANSEHVSLDATKHTLAINNIRPPDQGQVSVNVGVSIGYVVKLKHVSDDGPSMTIDHDDVTLALPSRVTP